MNGRSIGRRTTAAVLTTALALLAPLAATAAGRGPRPIPQESAPAAHARIDWGALGGAWRALAGLWGFGGAAGRAGANAAAGDGDRGSVVDPDGAPCAGCAGAALPPIEPSRADGDEGSVVDPNG